MGKTRDTRHEMREAREDADELDALRDALWRIEVSARAEMDQNKAGERDAFFPERIWSLARSHNNPVSDGGDK